MNAVTKTPRRKRATKGSAASKLPEQPSTDANERLETRSMSVVARAIVRAQTRALAYERLAVVAADLFRGNDARPPALLLKLPGGGPFPAEVEDVAEIEQELGHMASDARLKIARLMASAVLAKPEEVDQAAASCGPSVPTPPGEVVVENPTAKRASSVGATSGGPRGR